MVNSKSHQTLVRLCADALFCAIYFILSTYFSIEAGVFKFTLDGFPILFAALLFGPVDGLLVGLFGAFLSQFFKYGIGPTTILWILPAGIRGLLVGFLSKKYHFDVPKVPLAIAVLLTGILTTILNTGINYVDALIFSYSYPIFTVYLLYRLLAGIATSGVYAVLFIFLHPILIQFHQREPR